MKMNFSPAFAGFFISGLLLGLLGCSFDFQKVSTKPAIKVNAHVLTAKSFADKLARKLKNFDSLSAKDPNNVERAKQEIAREFILSSLIQDWAINEKISITDTDLDKEVNKLRASYPDDLSFRRTLAQENLSFADWREDLRNILLQRAVFAKLNLQSQAPTQDEIASYYSANKESFKKKERIKLRQIVLDDFSKAELVKSQLKKESFDSLAQKYSVAPEAKSGGLVGWVERGVVDIFDKAFSLPVGGVSQVLESTYGFHIFKIEEKASSGYSTVAEATPRILATLKGQREQAIFSAWLDKQLRQSNVLRDSDLIDSIKIETRNK
jgi:peptidyl-prolyl cis-trans isomerase C